MEPTWSTSTNSHTVLPTTAIRGGHLYISTYVGRAEHDGKLLAASVTANRKAYVAWDGEVHKKAFYEVLTGDGYKWRMVDNNQIPDNAVRCSATALEGNLYIGRGLYKDNLIVGTIHPIRRCLIAPYEGDELQLSSYEVLIFDKNPTWQKATFNTMPAASVVAGHDSDGALIYVGRAMHQGEMLPAKVIPSKTCCYVVYENAELYKPSFEVLCGSGYTWRKPINHELPESTVYSGISKDGEALYVGRGHYNGSVTPGVILQAERCLLLPFGGKAICVEDYEVLIKQ